MRLDPDALDQTDELTSEDIPGLDAGDVIYMRRMANALDDMKAEMVAYVRVDPDAADAPEPEEEDEAGAQPAGAFRLDTPLFLWARYEYMVTGWKLKRPNGKPYPYTPANKEKIWLLFAPQLIEAMRARTGAVATSVPTKVGPDGEAATFPEGAALDGAEPVA